MQCSVYILELGYFSPVRYRLTLAINCITGTILGWPVCVYVASARPGILSPAPYHQPSRISTANFARIVSPVARNSVARSIRPVSPSLQSQLPRIGISTTASWHKNLWPVILSSAPQRQLSGSSKSPVDKWWWQCARLTPLDETCSRQSVRGRIHSRSVTPWVRSSNHCEGHS